MVLYQFVRVYAFETQVLGFFCCALSMWFAYSYEMTFEIFYFILGSITHILAWVSLQTLTIMTQIRLSRNYTDRRTASFFYKYRTAHVSQIYVGCRNERK